MVVPGSESWISTKLGGQMIETFEIKQLRQIVVANARTEKHGPTTGGRGVGSGPPQNLNGPPTFYIAF